MLPVGLDIALPVVDAMLKQRWYNATSMLKQLWNDVVQRWKSDVEFYFIFNVGSTLFQHWSITLKQHWSDIDWLGVFLYCFTSADMEHRIKSRLNQENKGWFRMRFSVMFFSDHGTKLRWGLGEQLLSKVILTNFNFQNTSLKRRAAD